MSVVVAEDVFVNGRGGVHFVLERPNRGYPSRFTRCGAYVVPKPGHITKWTDDVTKVTCPKCMDGIIEDVEKAVAK